MAGLREQKKHQTRARILATAESLFAERGLREATMEEVAAAAEVSVGTLYNYFGSKTALQLALFEEETAAILERGARVVAEPGDDPRAAVEALFDAYLDGFLAIDRRLLLDAFKVGFSGGEFLPELVDLDLRLLEQVGVLLGQLADRGLVSSEHLDDGALLLYSALVTVLLFFLTVDATGPDEVRERLSRLVDKAFSGLQPARKKEGGR